LANFRIGNPFKKLKRIFIWAFLTLGKYIWGYGERPFRCLYSGACIVLLSALFYMPGELIINDIAVNPSFAQALSFSVSTMVIVGFVDIAPAGFSETIAVLQVFSARVLIPLFIVSLTRRYLRV